MAEDLPQDDIKYKQKNNPPSLKISGVEISIRPDFLLRYKAGGKKHIGALKILFIKDEKTALTITAQQYISTLCYHWLEKHGPSGWEPSNKLCLSLDIFRMRAVQAPTSFKRRLIDIENACSEIAALWPSVK